MKTSKKRTNQRAPATSASESASESESGSENRKTSSIGKKQVEANADLLVASPEHLKLQAKPASDGHVFLSYQSGSRQVVERMRERFEREGISTWMDKWVASVVDQ